jgi:chemotaxis family two-component system response regulator Rcp1
MGRDPHDAVRLLLVDDNEGDVRLTQEALKDSKLHLKLSIVNDGEEAMDYLRRQGSYADAERPDLILLDIHMPRKSGLEVLEEVKADPALREIPTVIMTSSSAEADIAKSYRLHANCYITKPLDFTQFTEVVRAVDHFWFSIVKLPNKQKV